MTTQEVANKMLDIMETSNWSVIESKIKNLPIVLKEEIRKALESRKSKK